MKHAFVIAVCLLMLAVGACKKRNAINNPANELNYDEKGCLAFNPWNNPQVVPQTDTVLIRYWLQENGITPTQIRIVFPHPEEPRCKACTCPSGRIVKVLFKTADIAKALSLGFYRP